MIGLSRDYERRDRIIRSDEAKKDLENAASRALLYAWEVLRP